MSNKPADIPVIMVAGGSGTIGAAVSRTLRRMGGLAIAVHRKLYDFRVESDVSLALLTAKPDIVINATSSLQTGPADAFRGTMSIGLNLMHVCAAARIRLIQLETPSLVWPWEDVQTIHTFLEAQNALESACDSYVAQHKLNAAVIRLPMVYSMDARRPDPISVVVAYVAKAVKTGAKEYTVPFHKDASFSMMHPDDTAATIVAIGASGRTGPVEVVSSTSINCGQIVAIAAQAAQCQAQVKFDTQYPVVPNESSWADRRMDAPIKFRVEDEIRRMVELMVELPGKESQKVVGAP